MNKFIGIKKEINTNVKDYSYSKVAHYIDNDGWMITRDNLGNNVAENIRDQLYSNVEVSTQDDSKKANLNQLSADLEVVMSYQHCNLSYIRDIPYKRVDFSINVNVSDALAIIIGFIRTNTERNLNLNGLLNVFEYRIENKSLSSLEDAWKLL